MGSIPIARSTLKQRQATQGYNIGVKKLIRWESLGKATPRGGGLIASRIPTLPRDSHAQSHAAVHKNKLSDSRAPLVARVIAGDWTRPFSAGDRRQLQGRETTLRTTSKINAVGSHRAIAPNDQRDPCGRLPGTAAPIPDTRGEER